MRLLCVLLLAAVALAIASQPSPHNAQRIPEKDDSPPSSRYPNVPVDKRAQSLGGEKVGDTRPENVTQIVLQYGYPCEDHTVVTPDGFVLSLQHIPHGRKGPTPKVRPVVILQHGLGDSSVGWTLNFPTESLSFILADNRYDVWLTNTRGNLYTMNNIYFNASDARFWDWSFDEMGQYDFPTMVNYVLNQSVVSSVSYIAHSLGATQAIVGLLENPGIHSKINLLVMLAPLAYMSNINSYLLDALAQLHTAELFLMLGYKEFWVPEPEVIKDLLGDFCGWAPGICEDLVSLVFGYSTNINLTRTPYYLHYEPNPTSVKTIAHLAQLIRSGTFQKFDYGPAQNKAKYNSTIAPFYNVTDLPFTLPYAVFSGGNDVLGDPTDVKRLLSQLPTGFPYPPFTHEEVNYSHLDPVLDMEAYLKIYPSIIRLLQTHNTNVNIRSKQ